MHLPYACRERVAHDAPRALASHSTPITSQPILSIGPPTIPINPLSRAMSSESTSLFSLARNKLQSVVGGGVKDSSSLHRWVLLKNSIIRSHPPSPTIPNATGEADSDSAYRNDQVFEEEDQDAFMFPDPHSIHDEDASANGESEWLDSLLEGLEDEEEDDFKVNDSSSALILPATDDDSEPPSPLYSPMSSSDDLVSHADFYPFSLPYPPLRPQPLPMWCELGDSIASLDSILPATPTLYDHPLPYFDVDDVEGSPVPDAIDDLSDDESDAPSTPSVGSTASISPPLSAPLSMPRERLLHPLVYIETDERSFYPFDVDPLPLPDSTSPSGRAFRRPYAEPC